GASSAQVAVAWVRAQGYRIIPIVGARKVAQLVDTLGTTTIELSSEHLAALDELSRPSLGFPHAFLGSGAVKDLVRGEIRTRLDGRPARG
ncbi:MAG: aldo/keto reductase, partial [Myxococcales bacterium]|nr:aldo/keto reductase [Myxococcales bacterium]